MGYELWRSKITGYRRRGTRAAELRQLLDEGITARAIHEPLRCCLFDDDALMVAEELKRLDFDIVGIKRDEEAKVEGYVRREDLSDGSCSQFLLRISPADLVAVSTPLVKVMEVLRDRLHVFTLVEDQVAGIMTRADLQKPPVRILLFNLISLFEMHLNFQINECYPHDSWTEKLSDGRLKKARELWEQRQQRNEEIDLLSCLQLSDKKTLLVKSEKMLEHFGLSHKKTADKLMKDIGKIRDKLAHSQDLVTGAKWEDIIDVSLAIQDMLERSDHIIEEAAICAKVVETG